MIWLLFFVVSLPWTWFWTVDDIIIYGDMMNMNISTFTMKWKFAFWLSNLIFFFRQGSTDSSDLSVELWMNIQTRPPQDVDVLAVIQSASFEIRRPRTSPKTAGTRTVASQEVPSCGALIQTGRCCRSLPSPSSSEWASVEYLFVFFTSFDQIITKWFCIKWWQTGKLMTGLIDDKTCLSTFDYFS